MSECLYIPSENIVLFREQKGRFGDVIFSLTDKAGPLEEATAIAKGKIPKVENVIFSDICMFEHESSKVKELIQNAKTKSQLEEKVRSGITSLLQQVYKSKIK